MENKAIGNQMIGVSVTRNEKNKLKSFFKEKADYVASDEFEQKFDKGIEVAKGVVGVLGATATIVLLVCPFDGPVGEIVSALATPGLIIAVDKLGDGLKGIYKSSKNIYSGSVNSETGKVEMGRVISDDTLTNIHKLSSSIGSVKNNSNDLKSMFTNNKVNNSTNNISK